MISTQRGAVAESIVCTLLLKRGREVCFPARGLSIAYDMVASDHAGKLQRIQVKRSFPRVRKGVRSLRVNCTHTNGKPYSATEVDVVAIVDADTYRVWWIPLEKINGQVSVTVTSAKYDQWLL